MKTATLAVLMLVAMGAFAQDRRVIKEVGQPYAPVFGFQYAQNRYIDMLSQPTRQAHLLCCVHGRGIRSSRQSLRAPPQTPLFFSSSATRLFATVPLIFSTRWSLKTVLSL
jgi:hypothetical protein